MLFEKKSATLQLSCEREVHFLHFVISVELLDHQALASPCETSADENLAISQISPWVRAAA